MTRTSLAAALLAVAAIAAGGCSATSQDTGGDDSNEPETEGITLYSGRIPAAIGGAIDAYEADADRDVQVRFGDTGDLAATLIEEGDNSPADVFFAQEPGAIGALAERGLLAELPQDILELVPPQYRDPDGRWVGVTGRARVIAYGSQVAESELPDSPLGLTDPQWKGRVGWSPVSDSLQQYVTALRLEYGDDDRPRVARGDGRQRRRRLPRQRLDPRRDRDPARSTSACSTTTTSPRRSRPRAPTTR